MMRRVLLILIAVIPFFTFAQKDAGSWKIYSRYTKVSQMEQTPDKIYFVSGNSLYSYDKNTQENYTYSSLNKLTENKVNKIYYNNKGKYLVITYSTGNIDLLYDNGKVVNVPVLKDAVLTYSPDVIDVSFNDNCIYFATKFGIVVYDESNHQVKTSGVYNKEISFITCVGDYVVVDQNHALYYIHKDGRFDSFDNFTNIASGNYFNDLQGISENKMLVYASNKNINLYTIDFELNKINATSLDATQSVTQLIKGKDDYYFVSSDSVIYSITSSGVKNTHSKLPGSLKSQTLSIWDNPNDIWAGDNNGIANYNIESGNADVVKDKTKPTSFTVDYPFYITSNANGKVFVSNHGESKYINGFVGNTWWFSYVNTIDGDKIEDATSSGLESVNGASPNYLRKDGKPYSSFNLVFDPEDPDTYYLSTYFDGIYKIKDGKQVAHYHEKNSTLLAIYGCRVFSLAFDKDNNLWCANEVGKVGDPCLHILPAEARKKETTTAEDWIPISLGEFKSERDIQLLICKKSNMIFISDGKWSGYVVAYDTKGTYADTSDDTYYLWDYFVDQDGNIFDPYQYSSLVEDENGHVWVGTTNGVFEITDPSKATDPSMTVKRLKLKNESGTGYSGYLLDALTILSISVDENNNKWLATTSNGVYYVDENGEKIYNHFTSDNSMLPPGIAYSVYVHPMTKSVFMGTANGLVEYNPSSSLAKENYSDVYVYPNPVKPDYTGWITINGLMQNSNVKIVDANGNTCYTCVSQGGKVTWDGCDLNGNRVKAGVYSVYASQGEIAADETPVTKIMVVN